MNKIIETILHNRNGQYCHALEVDNVYELEATVEHIVDEFYNSYGEKEVIDFFNTIELYCTNEANEQEVYNFNFEQAIKGA